jgi:hypothetical protein
VDEAVELAADVPGQAVAVERRCGEEVVEVLAKDVLENPRSGAGDVERGGHDGATAAGTVPGGRRAARWTWNGTRRALAEPARWSLSAGGAEPPTLGVAWADTRASGVSDHRVPNTRSPVLATKAAMGRPGA